jgi:putative zinc finger protein
MTKCSLPAALTDDDLSLAIDGNADEATRQHVARCPACRMRLEKMRQFERHLQRRLSRFECPAPQHLADYHAGMLDAEAAEAVREHLAGCPRCQDDLAALKIFLKLEAEVLIPDNIIPLSAPQTDRKATRTQISGNLALKGFDDETIQDMEAGSASIFLESKAVLKGFLLTGTVLDAQVDWVGALVEVWQDGAPQQVSRLDESCDFRFAFPAATAVDLYFTAANGATLLVEHVTIQP